MVAQMIAHDISQYPRPSAVNHSQTGQSISYRVVQELVQVDLRISGAHPSHVDLDAPAGTRQVRRHRGSLVPRSIFPVRLDSGQPV